MKSEFWWYSIGRTNEIFASQFPYFMSRAIVENDTPIFYVSSLSGQPVQVSKFRAAVMVRYRGVLMQVTRHATYLDRSKQYAVRERDGEILLGVRHDTN